MKLFWMGLTIGLSLLVWLLTLVIVYHEMTENGYPDAPTGFVCVIAGLIGTMAMVVGGGACMDSQAKEL